MFDLNVKWKALKSKDNLDMVKAAMGLGWTTIAWNTSTFGKFGAKIQKQSNSILLEQLDIQESTRLRKLTNSDGLTQVQQLNRISITIDDVVDAQALTAGNEYLKAYDIVAACPGNAAVFAYLCKTAQIDLISIDFTRRVPFPIIKKLLDQALARGVYFEIVYSPLLLAPHTRKDLLAGTRILVQFLRGRNLILSSGADSCGDVRGPSDVINIGQLLNLSQDQAKLAITKNCEGLISHARARKLKFMPLEIMPKDEVNRRWGKRSSADLVLGSDKDRRNDNNSTGDSNLDEQSSEDVADSTDNDTHKRRKIDSEDGAARGGSKPNSDDHQGGENRASGEESSSKGEDEEDEEEEFIRL